MPLLELEAKLDGVCAQHEQSDCDECLYGALWLSAWIVDTFLVAAEEATLRTMWHLTFAFGE